MNKYIIIVLLVLICSSIPIASAGLSDAVADSITRGCEGLFISIADTIFDMSFAGYNDSAFGGVDDSAGKGTVGYIYNIATYTPDPMNYQITKDFISFSKSIYAACYPILLLGAIVATLINHYKVDVAQRFAQATGINIGSKSNLLLKKATDAIIIALLMYVFIYLVFVLNNVMTKAVMISVLDSVAPTPDNYVLYFMMAIAYLIMGFFFSMRTLVMFLFCGFAFLVALCLLIEYTKEAAVNVIAYFVQTVFFQFFIVLYFSASILIIKAVVNPLDIIGLETMYTIMIIGGVYLGLKMMWGIGVIRYVGKTTAVLIK